MPNASKRVCCHPGCRALASEAMYCPAHQKKRAEERRRDGAKIERWRGSPSERGYDARWRAFRAEHLKLHPYCSACGALANVVDHVVPKEVYEDATEAAARTGVQSMCRSCHNGKTRREQLAAMRASKTGQTGGRARRSSGRVVGVPHGQHSSFMDEFEGAVTATGEGERR
ncbi:MAG: hypothetical protein GHCLOJNM_01582 [bacterium]|nr:hypothetical protein [bacterium]